MSSVGSRYAPEGAPDYSHRFHAGNVGDVWKHCALVEILRRAAAGRGAVRYVDTHAGEGRYALAPTGEWTEGIGRLWDARDLDDGAVARYVAVCRRFVPGGERPGSYPGSPLLARAVLGDGAALVLWERDAAACEQLHANVAAARITCGDGLAALTSLMDATVVLIDPPWTQKADWIAVPDAVIAAARALPGACLVLWYPVKSLTRPNAMLARFEAEGVPGTIAELVTTSLKHQRHRLNGSGVLLVRPPAGTLEALAASAPTIGRACATRQGAWSFRTHAW
ncbi:MAG TPA: 23S rRNA (adenine(2030)-N(6))-methyltransferase RlmJ [Candidatus Binatia bacterium]